MKIKFYKCNVCGKIVAIVKDTGTETFCCGQTMKEIIPKTKEGDLEDKHVPVVIRDRTKLIVFIGEEPHPMDEEHHIEWVAIRTNKGNQRKCIDNQEEARVVFYLDENEKVITVYAHCNIHGLWKRDLCRCANKEEGCTCTK